MKHIMNTMKQLLRIMAVALWLAAPLQDIGAAPALRSPFTVRQADGTWLTVRQYGDEYHHWTATADGTIVVSTAQGYCVAQIDDEGRLSATGVLAHEPDGRSMQEQTAVSRQQLRQALFHEQALRSSRRGVTVGGSSYLQHTGSPRILTVLAAFQDADFTVNDPVRAFDQYLNGTSQADLGNANQLNLSSVRQYFDICSQGQFTPQFDIVGPVVLPNKLSYYGGSDPNGTDERFSSFCKDATQQARGLVDDWSVYDNNGDGKIELVCVIFAGFGQNQGGADSTLWAKAAYQNVKLNDSLTIARYNCSSELFHPQYPQYINGNGVFIHEFSHCMGLPDLYATTSRAYLNNQGMETWSIMDYGLYNRNGYAPCPYTAWEQEVMGWTTIKAIDTEQHAVGDVLPLIEGGKAYKLVNGNNERDFMVMENIQKRGISKYASGHGLLVYHVDYPYTSVNMTDNPNNTPGHPSVAVVPACGLFINSYLRGEGQPYTTEEWKACMAASPFPGDSCVVSLTDRMQLPNYCFYDNKTAKPTGWMLNSITEDAETGMVSFNVAPDETSLVGMALRDDTALDRSTEVYDLQGRRLCRRPSAAGLRKGLYVVGGRLVVVR